jgi:hypothetical protein
MRSVRRQPSTSNIQPADPSPALVGALSQSAEIEARVEECADEISSITAVLKEEISNSAPKSCIP